MIWFIFAVIIAIAALITAASSYLCERGDAKRLGLRVIGAVVLLLAFGLFMLSGVKSVPVKNIGVPQSFGAVGSTAYQPGLHETWQPWLSITNIDETVQTTSFKDGGNDNGSSCNGGLPVRIGGQQTACADITIQWQVLPQAASSLFSDYANKGDLMTEIKTAVVLREFEQVVNNRLGDYNPITDVQSTSGSVTGAGTQTSQFTSFAPQILTDMQHDIGTRVRVLSVLMPQLHYSSTIEDKLAAIQQAYADYAVSQENVKVNHENALALAQLGSPTLAQLVAQCIKEAGANAGQCIPGAVSKIALSQAPRG